MPEEIANANLDEPELKSKGFTPKIDDRRWGDPYAEGSPEPEDGYQINPSTLPVFPEDDE